MELRRATLARREAGARIRTLNSEGFAGSVSLGWTRVVALVAAAVSFAAAWLGFPGVVFHISSSLGEWLMPLVQ